MSDEFLTGDFDEMNVSATPLAVLEQFFACVRTLLSDIAAGNQQKLEQCTQRFELLFGTKTSPADSIVKIVELYLRLQEMRRPNEAEDAAYAQSFALNEADAALLDAFILKMRTTES